MFSWHKTSHTVRILSAHLRRYPWIVAATLAVGLLASLAEGLGISLFIPLLQSLEQTAPTQATGSWLADALWEMFKNHPPQNRLFFLSMCIFAALFFKAVFSYGRWALYGWLDTSIAHHIRSLIFSQLLTADFRLVQRHKNGTLVNTLGKETWKTSEAALALLSLVITSCTLVVYTCFLLLISWQLTLLVGGAMAAISAAIKILLAQVKKLGYQETQANNILTERSIESCEGMETIRSFGTEQFERQRFGKASERIRKVGIKIWLTNSAVHPIYEFLVAALLVVVLFFTLQTAENLPAVIAFIFILYRLQPRLIELDKSRAELLSLGGGVEATAALLEQTRPPAAAPTGAMQETLRQGIFVKGATFAYTPAVAPVFTDFSLAIPAGKTTAVVGPSGSGKSTLIRLILGLYKPQQGAIFLDDTPLDTLDMSSWRRQIAVVSQHTFVFNTTIRANLTYGNLAIPPDHMQEMAKRADAHAFIQTLPAGYDTVVGDRGIALSGGQLQRLALARALLRDPQVLILDEATNALDSISEDFIQNALESFSRNRTVIVIAHRLSTIKSADHIVVLEEGQIREQGNFQHVLALNGLFTRIYNLQFQRPA